MHSGLASILFDRQLLTGNMEIEAKFDATALGNVNTISTTGFFHIKSVSRNADNDIIFLCASTVDGRLRVFHSDNVVGIDGMTPTRFAAVYNIAADGGSKRTGKRRGRKPKIRLPQGDLNVNLCKFEQELCSDTETC